VYNHYDNLPNSRLLVNFGFALQDNPNDEIPLKLPVPPNDALRREKVALLEERQIDNEHTILYGGRIPMELMELVRVLLVDDAAVLTGLAGAATGLGNTGPGKASSFFVSSANDLKVVILLKATIVSLMSNHPTTIEHDKHLLKENAAMPPAVRSGVICRMGEKTVLQHAVQTLSRWEQALNSGSARKIEELAELQNQPEAPKSAHDDHDRGEL
jgi:hypothetical protein